MHWNLGFALLIAVVVVWLYSSLRAELSSIVEMLKRVIDAKETREHEQITDVATENEQLIEPRWLWLHSFASLVFQLPQSNCHPARDG